MKKLATLILILGMVQQVMAETNAGAFLDKGLQARYAALGQSGAALSAGSESMVWNPAGLSLISGRQLELSGMRAYETDQFAITSATRYKRWPIGVVLHYAKMGGIDKTTYNTSISRYAKTGEQLSYQAQALGVGTAKKVSGKLDIGASAKVISEKAAGYASLGFGLDLGMLYRPKKEMAVGLMLKNVNEPKLKWDTPSGNTDRIPRETRLGMAWQPISALLVIGEWIGRNHRPSHVGGGVEYRIIEMVPIRLGVRQGQASLGTGLNTETVKFDVSWTKTKLDIMEDEYRFTVEVAL